MVDIDLIIFGFLFILGILFMLITLISRGSFMTLTASASTTVLFFILGVYFPIMQPTAPGLSWIFYGLGIIFLLVMLVGVFNSLKEKRNKRYGGKGRWD